MNIKDAPLNGLIILEPRLFADERGPNFTESKHALVAQRALAH